MGEVLHPLTDSEIDHLAFRAASDEAVLRLIEEVRPLRRVEEEAMRVSTLFPYSPCGKWEEDTALHAPEVALAG
jgi:hypothetical protein